MMHCKTKGERAQGPETAFAGAFISNSIQPAPVGVYVGNSFVSKGYIGDVIHPVLIITFYWCLLTLKRCLFGDNMLLITSHTYFFLLLVCVCIFLSTSDSLSSHIEGSFLKAPCHNPRTHCGCGGWVGGGGGFWGGGEIM